ncbi:MAG: hypothetical protein AAGF11_20040 [Myxococcota bacterium]
MNVIGENLGVFLERRGPLGMEAFALVAASILRPLGELHARSRALGTIEPREIVLCPDGSSVTSVHLLRGPLARVSADLSGDICAIGRLFELMLWGQHGAPRKGSCGAYDRLLDLIGRCTGTRPGERPQSADEVLEELIDIVPVSSLIPRSSPARAEPEPVVLRRLRWRPARIKR